MSFLSSQYILKRRNTAWVQYENGTFNGAILMIGGQMICVSPGETYNWEVSAALMSAGWSLEEQVAYLGMEA